MQLLVFLLLLLLPFPCLSRADHSQPAPATLAKRITITAVVAPDLPPTFYKDPDTGRPIGFAIDVMDEVAKRAGLQVRYIYGKPWDEMQQLVLSGAADVNPSLIVNEARSQALLFTDSVETMPINYLVRSSDQESSRPQPGMTVGMMKGSTAEEYLKGRTDLRLVTYSSMHHLLMELLAGRIDMVMTATPNIRKLAIDAGVEDRIRVIEPPVLEGKRAMALRPDDVALQQRLNRAIDAFLGTPEYQTLYTKWWGKPQPYWTTQRVALGMGLLLLGITAALLLWRFVGISRLNRRLREEVVEREAANLQLQQALAIADQLAEHAQRANQSKSEFLANMSHELRTPLNGILGMLQLLETCQPTEEQLTFIATASKSGWNLLALLDDILDLSRIETGHLTLYPTEVELATLTRSVLALFALQAQQNGIQLTATVDPELPTWLRLDEKRLRQILLNLIGNAVKFTPSGTVRLDVRVKPGKGDNRIQVEIIVADTGIGIPAEQMQQMFEPFVQGESTYHKRYQGAGLGLAIVKRLVDAMDGKLQIDSRPGQGTTITLTLWLEPGMAPLPTALLPAAAPLLPRQSLRILVVEDNPENRKLLELILHQEKHIVATAHDGRHALQLLAANDFDLVLMDIQMPVMDGMEALQQIRHGAEGVRNPQVPVVALTAYAMTGDREKFLAAGMNDYLSKPIQLAKLKELLHYYSEQLALSGRNLPCAPPSSAPARGPHDETL